MPHGGCVALLSLSSLCCAPEGTARTYRVHIRLTFRRYMSSMMQWNKPSRHTHTHTQHMRWDSSMALHCCTACRIMMSVVSWMQSSLSSGSITRLFDYRYRPQQDVVTLPFHFTSGYMRRWNDRHQRRQATTNGISPRFRWINSDRSLIDCIFWILAVQSRRCIICCYTNAYLYKYIW